MEKSTANTEGQKQMSDVAMAQSYVRDIGGGERFKVTLARAYRKLTDMFPHEKDPENQWTERRVRGFLSADAATVQFREMVELHRAAVQAKAERELIKRARKEHAAFIEKTANLRALLEHQDQDFHCDQIEGMGRGMGRVDRARTSGE